MQSSFEPRLAAPRPPAPRPHTPRSFDIVSSTGSYTVSIDVGALQGVLQDRGETVFIVDAFLAPRLIVAGHDPIVVVAEEPAKSLDRMTEVIVALRDRRATRDTVIVAIGGGVVQDVAAFAASIYMRGIDWIYVPTTLLSMTDSCIGGKSSINVGRYKNIVGTFHPPRRIVIDPAMTATLSAEQKAAGLCEAAKICLCRDAATLARYLALAPHVDADAATLADVVALSLETKKWFIEIDEFDQAERLLLNFGHTFGHAIEAASRFGVGHGIAVGLGMIAALRLGQEMGRDYTGLPHIAAFHAHVAALLASVDGLPTVLAAVQVADLMEAFGGDKKHKRDRYAVILIDGDGAIERRLVPRDAATTAMIERAFRSVIDDWRPARSMAMT